VKKTVVSRRLSVVSKGKDLRNEEKSKIKRQKSKGKSEKRLEASGDTRWERGRLARFQRKLET